MYICSMENKVGYYHKRLDTGEIFYVGIGTPLRPYEDKNRNNHWNHIVEKFGYEVILVKENLSWEDACDWEISEIQRIGRRDLGLGTLVNFTDGGEGMENPSIETRKKLSESRTGEKNHKFGKPTPKDTCEKISNTLTGRKLPKDTCIKMSESRTGDKHPMYNKHHREDSKQKMREQKIGKMEGDKNPFFGKTHTEESSKKISESGKGRKWVNNGLLSVTAKGQKLDELLNSGWVFGRIK